MIKQGLLVVLALVIMLTPAAGEAKTINRYATKTVSLKEQASTKSKTICKVKQNKKLAVIKQGKAWAAVSYEGKTLYVKKVYLHKKKAKNVYPGKSLKRRGRGRWNGASWTWYTQRQLPGRGLKIPGRHLDKRGFVCDKDGYICLASGRSNKKKKIIVPTPFGKFGKVYDTNGGYNNRWFDVYTNW